MTWDELDWTILDRLREGFLHGGAAGGPYWESRDDLAHYDFTYAERIGWKWDAVLRELQRRGWRPPGGALLDWGCGSGVAGRRVAAAWPQVVEAIHVWDHSPIARQFAREKAALAWPERKVAEAGDETPPAGTSTLVISHVLNELNALTRDALLQAIQQVQAVLWVEPGTSDVANELIRWRERLGAEFRFVLPCPHQGRCGLFQPGNERHWCHHFAPPPAGIFADSQWVRFGQRAGIDLRSLPYSVLIMERHALPERAALPADTSRILGRPDVLKPYARLLNCDATGVQELTLPKRLDPALYRRLDRPEAPRLFRWECNDASIQRLSVL
jgi:SAM-dependent methyltransferase